jgi:hypothetical protein
MQAHYNPVNHEGGMTTFDKREEGFEKKFAHDEELQFKAMARRNKLSASAAGFSARPARRRGLCKSRLSDFEEPATTRF